MSNELPVIHYKWTLGEGELDMSIGSDMDWLFWAVGDSGEDAGELTGNLLGETYLLGECTYETPSCGPIVLTFVRNSGYMDVREGT